MSSLLSGNQCGLVLGSRSSQRASLRCFSIRFGVSLGGSLMGAVSTTLGSFCLSDFFFFAHVLSPLNPKMIMAEATEIMTFFWRGTFLWVNAFLWINIGLLAYSKLNSICLLWGLRSA